MEGAPDSPAVKGIGVRNLHIYIWGMRSSRVSHEMLLHARIPASRVLIEPSLALQGTPSSRWVPRTTQGGCCGFDPKGQTPKRRRLWRKSIQEGCDRRFGRIFRKDRDGPDRGLDPKGQTPKRRRLWRKSIQEGCDRRFGRAWRKDRDGPDRRLWVPPLSVPAAASALRSFARFATHSV